MINKWQELESRGSKFLNNLFPCVNFRESGGSNANESDITVTNYQDKILFRIEAKMIPAQAGQITVVDEGDKFSLSEQSSNPNNSYTAEIINRLNINYSNLVPVGRTGKVLNIEESILINWVKQHYLSKDNSWMLSITKNDILSKESLTLVSIHNLEKYFTVKAVFRIKKSGSSNIAKSRIEDVKKVIKEQYPSLNIDTDIIIEGKKMYLTKYIGGGKKCLDNGYFIGAFNDNKYVITRRNMNPNPNPNIMFEIGLRQRCFQEIDFLNFLKSCDTNC